jgi:hypothetical protein
MFAAGSQHAYPRPAALSVLFQVFSRPREGLPPGKFLAINRLQMLRKTPFHDMVKLKPIRLLCGAILPT